MNAELESALTILMVGMTTVFGILLLVVLSARSIIWVTNSLAENEVALIHGRTVRAPTRSSIPQDHQKIISKVVDQISGSRGTVIQIKQIE